MLQNLGQAIAREGLFVVKAVKNYQVIGAGYARITAQGRWADGHSQTFSWRVDLTGTE